MRNKLIGTLQVLLVLVFIAIYLVFQLHPGTIFGDGYTFMDMFLFTLFLGGACWIERFKKKKL